MCLRCEDKMLAHAVLSQIAASVRFLRTQNGNLISFDCAAVIAKFNHVIRMRVILRVYDHVD